MGGPVREPKLHIFCFSKDWFDEVVSAEDRGLSYFRGLVLGTPLEVVNVTKSLLVKIWSQNFREHLNPGMIIRWARVMGPDSSVLLPASIWGSY